MTKYKCIVIFKNGRKATFKSKIDLSDMLKFMDGIKENFKENYNGNLRIDTVNIKLQEVVYIEFKRCLI